MVCSCCGSRRFGFLNYSAFAPFLRFCELSERFRKRASSTTTSINTAAITIAVTTAGVFVVIADDTLIVNPGSGGPVDPIRSAWWSVVVVVRRSGSVSQWSWSRADVSVWVLRYTLPVLCFTRCGTPGDL